MRTGFRRLFLLTCCCFCLLQFAPPTASADEEFRTWEDAKGKNKITAKFVKVDGAIVTLEKEDGEEVEIELNKLSAASRKYVEAAIKGDSNPFQKKSTDPFKAKPKSEKVTDSDDGPDDSEAKPAKFNYKATKQIKLSAPGKTWKLDVSESNARSTIDTNVLLPLPPRIDFFEKMNGFALGRGPAATKAVTSYCLEKGGAATTRVVLTDLEKGESTDPLSATGQFAAIALHDDGQQVIMRRAVFGFGNNDRLEVWKIKGDRLTRSVTWTPYDYEKNGGARDVSWAAFLDEERLLTGNSSGRVIVWKYPEIKPVSAFDTTHGCQPALSADRKYLAYSTGSAIGVMDIGRQKVLAQQDVATKLNNPVLAFSPTSKRLACAASDQILVWDTADGKLLHTIPGEGTALNGQIEFVDDNHLLAGKSCLIEVDSELKLWTYQGAEFVESNGGIALFVFNNWQDKPGALIPARLPHAAAQELFEKAQTDPSQFALHAGTKVKIDVSAIPDVAQRDRVMKSLTKKLEAIKCTVDSQGEIDLIASVTGPKDTEISFIGRGDYKFKEYHTNVKFVYQNTPAWESWGGNSPGVVTLKQGETMESHLRSIEKPNYDFFDRINFPKFLPKPVPGQGASHTLTIGTSKISESGIH